MTIAIEIADSYLHCPAGEVIRCKGGKCAISIIPQDDQMVALAGGETPIPSSGDNVGMSVTIEVTGLNGRHGRRLHLCQIVYGRGESTVAVVEGYGDTVRSEEHTSELQSRENLVC